MSGRPEALYKLFSTLEALDGVGPKTVKNFSGLDVAAPRDLLFTLPFSAIDRTVRRTIEGAHFPDIFTVEVTVGAHRPGRTKGAAYRIWVTDAQTSFQLVFFHAHSEYLTRALPEGSRKLVSGRIEVFDGTAQMVHPDHILAVSDADILPKFEPVYPLTAGITQKIMHKAVKSTLSFVSEFDEWIDPTQISQEKWPSFAEALRLAHIPENGASVSPDSPQRLRLAYDEFFAHQLTLALARKRDQSRKGVSTVGSGRLQERVLAELPYHPTSAQKRAMDEIADDMANDTRMNRLLQGDVGAGKTLVAFMSMLRSVEAGGQAVLMAPTEILARQHLEGMQKLAADAGVRLDILTGRDKRRDRKTKLEALAEGEINLLVGTHAVFQKDVVFRDLRLVVIDEQHRFGVRQRLELGKKGIAPDILVMTATPIPRSLSLVQYGDMDVSILDEKPPGRKPIKTVMVSTERIDEVVERLRYAVESGRQCYWVCPLVEESEAVTLTAAEERFKKLRAELGVDTVGLVHGQMQVDEKDKAMAMFQEGLTKVLVATTVIEVGVDVPNATIIVIERAEIFGLAQLHQLRGRVGRGDVASTCLLLYQAPLSDSGRRRLEILRETEDGFAIAEFDLKMRGAGDAIGTTQSGLPRFRVADLERQAGLMAIAQSDARKLLAEDPKLKSKRGEAARVLLWLMRREESIGLISVG